MKTFLVPTDFSKSASVALSYAIGMAKEVHAEIILVHAFHLNFASMDGYHHIPKPGESTENAAAIELKHLKQKVESSGVKCQTINKEALASDLIIDTATSKKADLIIMGTKGASGLLNTIMGSNTARVIEKARVPVLAIPENTVYGPFKELAFATNFHESDLTAMKILVKIVETSNATITLVHIVDKTTTDSIEEHKKFHDFKLKLINVLSYDKLAFKLLYGHNPAEELETFIENHKPDLIAMSTEQRTFFDHLFERSTTKQIANHIRIPLLSFHFTQHSIIFI